MRAVVARLWRPVVASALVHLLFLVVYLAKFHGDASVLICAGAQRTGVPPYEYVTRTIGPSGHDGQFYYSLARAPWRRHGLDIDVPAGRHLRIGYPALCWLLSAGEPHLLFYVMPAINFGAIVVLSALELFWLCAAAKAHGGGLSCRWGRIWASPCCMISLMRFRQWPCSPCWLPGFSMPAGPGSPWPLCWRCSAASKTWLWSA